MQKFKIEFTVTILICLTAVAASEVFKIFRKKAGGNSGWREGTDSFTIPPSLCHVAESSSMNCARFNAKNRGYNSDPCHCFCSSENASLIFDKDQWRCKKNSDVRDLLGYAFPRYTLFYGESKHSPLPILDASDEERIDISSPQFVKNCRVVNDSSLYIGCGGVEVPFNSNQFTINKHGYSDADGGIQYYLKVNSGESSTDLIEGKIIKLSIRCDYWFPSTGKRHNTCSLLFKYAGNVTCYGINVREGHCETGHCESVLTKTKDKATTPLQNCDDVDEGPNLQPSKQYFTTRRQTRANLLPSASLHVIKATKSTKTGSLGSTVSESSPNVSVSPSTTSVIQRTVVVSSPTKRSRDIQPTVSPSDVSPHPTGGSEKSSGDDSVFPPSLIAGVIGIIAVVIVIIIVGSLVYRRHNLNQTPRASTIRIDETKRDSAILKPQINAAFAPDDQDLYRSLSLEEPPIYGKHYEIPNCPSTEVTVGNLDTQSSKSNVAEEHYASLNNSEEQNIYGHGDTQEPLYNVLEKPVSEDEIMYECYGPTVKGPVSDDIEQVYNVLDEADIESPEGPVNDDAEPVYNVLDEPDIESPEGPVNDDAEPVYNVLDEPDIESPEGPVDHGAESVYNVLEGLYMEGSEGSDHYGANSGEGPFYSNTLNRLSQDCNVGPNGDSQYINEPVYSVVEDETYQTYQSHTTEDDFVTSDFVKNVLQKLELE